MTAAATALLLAFPVSAAARERDVPSPGPLPAGAQLGQFDSTVLQSDAGAMRTARAAGPAPRRYATPDGYSVAVEASSDYPVDPVADQKLVDFLASRVHGAELGDLSVYVGTPKEISQLCGGDPEVVACYAIDQGRMYVPGESVRGIPVEYPLTHEYGHHVASRRSNSPWDALDWGAKYWSSAMRICSGVRSHLLFPGNQGAHYWDDPGEGFADGYAHMHYPEAPWYYNQLLRPNAKAFTAIQRDVLHPWTGPRSRTFHGRLGRRKRIRTFHIRLTLDGDVRLALAAPRGAVYEVAAETRGFAAGQRLRDSGEFGVEWCRRRPVDEIELTVRRRAGSGPFTLRVSWPG
ncbi:MAG: hypothetical protein H0T69_01235 [Thermoleophilaceae bacterium]|nr:hypothetical protein [Thermoleophilaceae bacterium]